MTSSSLHKNSSILAGRSPLRFWRRNQRLLLPSNALDDARASVSSDGFALIEVISALLIASLLLSATIASTAASLARTATARELALASADARSLLARLGSELPLAPGVTSGQQPRPWRLSVEPLTTNADAVDGNLHLVQLRLEIFATRPTSAPIVDLVTYRLIGTSR